MSKTIIAEGKTTNEAIEKGLKELNVSRNCVDIKVIDEDKRSFFSILAPRVVKVEMTLKECVEKEEKINNKREIIALNDEEIDIVKENLNVFLNDFFGKISGETNFDIEIDEKNVFINVFNKNLGFLIGYRGETLYAFQNILSSIASKGIEKKVRVILDIEGYKDKRKKTLEDLAEKVSKTVIKTKKSVTLEPMQPYERKIIHSKLQDSNKVETVSVGEEPYRKVVISLKNNK